MDAETIGTALMSYSAAEAKRANPTALREEIRKAFRNDRLWDKIKPYLAPPGVCGSKAFDQANVVRELLDWDDKNGKKFAQWDLSQRLLWNHVYAVIGSVFQTSHGRIVGLLENKKDGDGNGADIE